MYSHAATIHHLVLAGGKAIELMARSVENKTSLEFLVAMRSYRDCRFSFTGQKATIHDHIAKANTRSVLDCDEMVPIII